MKSNKIIGLILGFAFFMVGFFTLPHYGVNWDTINHLPRGQAYLNFFLTGKKDFSNLPTFKDYWQDPDSIFIKTDIPKKDLVRRSIYQSDATTFSWFIENEKGGHPPVSDILSSFFNVIFFQKLGIINDIDSYRVYGIFISSLLILVIFVWISEIHGVFAGLVASISLAIYPLFWAESHFNVEKDIPETVFYSLFLYFVWKGITLTKYKWILMSGILLGLALGTKLNILFSIFILVPWILVLLKTKFFKNERLLLSICGAIAIAITIFVGSWPFLWPDVVSGIYKIIGFYKAIGLTNNIDARFLGPFGTNSYPITWIIYSTPLVILFFTFVGIINSVRNLSFKNYSNFLFLLWLVVPITRVSIGGTTIYGGVRQIMEFIPALAILSGLGASHLRTFVSRFLSPKKASFLILALFVPIIIKLISIHPNENVYFNPLVGGLSGAKKNNLSYWGNSFGSAYRQGVIWINKNADKNAKVVLAYELLPNIPQIFFRQDISFHNSKRSGFLRNGEYAITLVYDGTENRSYYDAYLERFLIPSFQVKVDDVPILKVWKNEDVYLKKPNKEIITENVAVKAEEDALVFELAKSENLSRLEINYYEKNCKPLTYGEVIISKNGETWESLPGILPRSWKISELGMQPSSGGFIEPFVGQEAKFIKLILAPEDTCLKLIKSYKLYTFEN